MTNSSDLRWLAKTWSVRKRLLNSSFYSQTSADQWLRGKNSSQKSRSDITTIIFVWGAEGRMSKAIWGISVLTNSSGLGDGGHMNVYFVWYWTSISETIPNAEWSKLSFQEIKPVYTPEEMLVWDIGLEAICEMPFIRPYIQLLRRHAGWHAEARFGLPEVVVSYNSSLTCSSNWSLDRLSEITMQTVRLYSRAETRPVFEVDTAIVGISVGRSWQWFPTWPWQGRHAGHWEFRRQVHASKITTVNAKFTQSQKRRDPPEAVNATTSPADYFDQCAQRARIT